MGSSMIAVEIFCMIVLFILLYSHLFSKVKEARDVTFTLCIVSCIIANLIDCLSYVVTDYYPQYISSIGYSLLLAASYAMAFVHCFFVFKYIEIVAQIKKGVVQNVLKCFRVVLLLFAAVIFFEVSSGYFVVDSADGLSEGYMYQVYVVMQIIHLTMLVTMLVLVKKKIEKDIFRAICFGSAASIVTNVLGLLSFGEDLVYPAYALILLILHLLVQEKRVNLSQVEKAQDALKRAEQMNEMLQSANAKLEEESKNLEAVASMYKSMYMIDIPNDRYSEIVSTYREKRFINEKDNKPAQETIWHVMVNVSRVDYEDCTLSFTNISTLEERMRGKKVIYLDMVNNIGQNWRCQFIRIGKIEEELTKVLYTTQLLDEI